MSITCLCLTAVLDISSNSTTTTTWYLPLFNYTGSLYISQVDVSGSLIGSGVWSNVSAKSFSVDYYTHNYKNNSMVVGYNANSPAYGFTFTGVSLSDYSLYVTFTGLIQRTNSFALTLSNPYSVLETTQLAFLQGSTTV